MEKYHSTPTGGHAGVAKTYSCLSANATENGTRKEVSNFVPKCKVCQQTDYLPKAPARLAINHRSPSKLWEDISNDFVISLHAFQEYNHNGQS